MPRKFTLPKFPVNISIWRSSSWLATFPDLPDADVTCKANLVPGLRTQGAEMDTSNLLIPIGTDIRFTEDGTWDEFPTGTEDLVEVGTGSGYFYKVYNVERSALGFDNCHLIANLVQLSPVPIDVGIPEDNGVGEEPDDPPDDEWVDVPCDGPPDVLGYTITGPCSCASGYTGTLARTTDPPDHFPPPPYQAWVAPNTEPIPCSGDGPSMALVCIDDAWQCSPWSGSCVSPGVMTLIGSTASSLTFQSPDGCTFCDDVFIVTISW